MNGTILHPAYDIHIQYQIFKRANGYKPWMFNNKLDACRYLRHPYDPVLAIVYGLFKDFSNINHTCPYKGPQILKDFYLRHELLRLPIPTGNLRNISKPASNRDKKLQFDTNISFTYFEDYLKQK
ncbi:hypothetical protein KR084_009290 [Drosophila pseudotakahashii]|nr:hypothetical protein KR084_009290 [Drosophila pseudotakahashii]